jgi:hypothetical protein
MASGMMGGLLCESVGVCDLSLCSGGRKYIYIYIYIDNSASSWMLRNQMSANRTDRPPDFDVIQTQIRHEGYKSQDTIIALLTPTTSLYKRLIGVGRDITEILTCYADRLPQVATPQPWSLLPLVSIEYTLCNPSKPTGLPTLRASIC